jgi:hypothetical protein
MKRPASRPTPSDPRPTPSSLRGPAWLSLAIKAGRTPSSLCGIGLGFNFYLVVDT